MGAENESKIKSFTLVIDESGAKGYSDNEEKEIGEFGVMVGFLIPSNFIEEVRNDFGNIANNYSTTGKLHITELDSNDQEALRQEIFNYFLKRRIYWAYDAVPVQGYYIHHKSIEDIIKNSNIGESDIKVSRNKRFELLHADLFQGVFSKCVVFLKHLSGHKLNLNIISDRLDKEIIDMFCKKTDEFLNIEKPDTTAVSGFNIKTKKVVKKAFAIKIKAEDNVLDDYSNISYSLTCEDTSLTLVADVIANSLHHHLQSHKLSELNSSKAIKGYALDSLAIVTNSDQIRDFSDLIYKHPASDEE